MGRLKGCLWLTAGLVVALLAGFVAYTTLQRATAQEAASGAAQATLPTVEVVAAARAVEIRSALGVDDLQLIELPVDAVPEGAVSTLDAAVGKLTLVELYPGEVILSQRLLDPNVVARDGRLALVLAEDQVLMAFPVGDLMSRMNVLKPGDRVDLLFSMDFPAEGIDELTGSAGGAVTRQEGQEEQVTFDLMQNVSIAAVVGGQTQADGARSAPQALLLTVGPQDALIIKYALDAGGVVDIVLRAPGMEGPFDVDPVDINYLIDRFQIPTMDLGR